MKKIFTVLLPVLLVLMSACSVLPAGATAPQEPTATPGVIAVNYPNAMPVSSQLALGTLRLKGSGNDLTSDEAAALLFLWKGLNTVATASSPAKPEIDALVSQIQQTMKPAQVEAIAAMKLTNADIAATAQQLGLAFSGPGGGGAGGSGNGSSTTNRSGGNTGGGGGGFQGGGGGAFFGGPGGFGQIPGAGGNQGNNTTSRSSGNVPASTQATIQARATQRAISGNTALYLMVINYLQNMVAAPTPAPSK